MINLRGRHPSWGWWLREEQACRGNRIKHFDVTLDSRHLPTRQMLLTLLTAFDLAPTPCLMKCSGGQDRASLAAALYLIHSRGWIVFESAQAQFKRFPYLHFPRRQQRWLKQFLDYASSQAQGATLAAWVRNSYEPRHFAAWLAAKGMGDSFKGVFPYMGQK